MTIDIARVDTAAVATLNGANDALARLGQWVEAARNAHQLVAPLIGTAFIPDSYRPKVDPRATDKQKQEAYEVAVANATAAVLQGITLGLDPMTALQQIYLVHGRPGMYAKLMVALVQSHGHQVWTEDESDTRVVVAGRRFGTDTIERVTITMDQARKAGWTTNQAYSKTPRDMLWSRAAARVCDRIASDALKGIASVEEIQDSIPPGNGGMRTVSPRRRAALAVVAEPPLEDDSAVTDKGVESVETVESTVAPHSITGPQQKKLHALLRERGLGDRDTGLRYLSDVLGRTIESTKDLTVADAGAAIDALEAEQPTTPQEPPLEDGEP